MILEPSTAAILKTLQHSFSNSGKGLTGSRGDCKEHYDVILCNVITQVVGRIACECANRVIVICSKPSKQWTFLMTLDLLYFHVTNSKALQAAHRLMKNREYLKVTLNRKS